MYQETLDKLHDQDIKYSMFHIIANKMIQHAIRLADNRMAHAKQEVEIETVENHKFANDYELNMKNRKKSLTKILQRCSKFLMNHLVLARENW